MKKFIKQEKITIIVFLILIIWLIPIFFSIFNYHNTAPQNLTKYTMIAYKDVFTNYSFNMFPILAPVFVMIPTFWTFHSNIHSGNIKNILLRMSYNDYLKMEYIKAIKRIIIFPLIIIFIYFMCYLTTIGVKTDELAYEVYEEWYGLLGAGYNLIYFAYYYLLNIVFHSIFYTHIILWLVKKNKYKITTVILGFLMFLFITFILEFVVGALLVSKFLGVQDFGLMFSTLNILTWDGIVSEVIFVGIGLALAILSFIPLIFIYKNKEGVIIESEK